MIQLRKNLLRFSDDKGNWINMPELPEVETTRNGITPHICHKTVRRVIVRNSQLRWPVPTNLPELIVGRKLLDIHRRGKYLLLKFSHGTILWHLGMSGNLRIVDDKCAVLKHDHIDVIFSSKCILRFNDPRRFGSVLWDFDDIEQNKLITKLGPEPLSGGFSANYLFLKSRKVKKPVKGWIMDGSVVVGVGNIYASESLFDSRIHPLKKAARLSQHECEMLTRAIKNILAKAIARGGTTLKDFVNSDGSPGYFSLELKVYGRAKKPCKVCGKQLTEKRIAQRSSFYCTACQK